MTTRAGRSPIKYLDPTDPGFWGPQCAKPENNVLLVSAGVLKIGGKCSLNCIMISIGVFLFIEGHY